MPILLPWPSATPSKIGGELGPHRRHRAGAKNYHERESLPTCAAMSCNATTKPKCL